MPGPRAAYGRVFDLLKKTNRRLDEASAELEQEAIARLVVEGWDAEDEQHLEADFPVAMDALRKALGMEAPS